MAREVLKARAIWAIKPNELAKESMLDYLFDQAYATQNWNANEPTISFKNTHVDAHYSLVKLGKL